jgi:hypothetical protein
MARNKKNRCYYCHKWHPNEKKARECENGHDVIMVPLLKEDLNRLVNFIATGDRALLTESLSLTLFRYFRSGLKND